MRRTRRQRLLRERHGLPVGGCEVQMQEGQGQSNFWEGQGCSAREGQATQEPWQAETKLPYHDCSVHKGQGYCENDTANNCHWGDKSAQCLGPGKPDKVGHRK
jgi:hypothetical protein